MKTNPFCSKATRMQASEISNRYSSLIMINNGKNNKIYENEKHSAGEESEGGEQELNWEWKKIPDIGILRYKVQNK